MHHFNWIELTVKFREKETFMTSLLDKSLELWFLIFKVVLLTEQTSHTAASAVYTQSESSSIGLSLPSSRYRISSSSSSCDLIVSQSTSSSEASMSVAGVGDFSFLSVLGSSHGDLDGLQQAWLWSPDILGRRLGGQPCFILGEWLWVLMGEGFFRLFGLVGPNFFFTESYPACEILSIPHFFVILANSFEVRPIFGGQKPKFDLGRNRLVPIKSIGSK